MDLSSLEDQLEEAGKQLVDADEVFDSVKENAKPGTVVYIAAEAQLDRAFATHIRLYVQVHPEARVHPEDMVGTMACSSSIPSSTVGVATSANN